jgi:hypothetical protein
MIGKRISKSSNWSFDSDQYEKDKAKLIQYFLSFNLF